MEAGSGVVFRTRNVVGLCVSDPVTAGPRRVIVTCNESPKKGDAPTARAFAIGECPGG